MAKKPGAPCGDKASDVRRGSVPTKGRGPNRSGNPNHEAVETGFEAQDLRRADDAQVPWAQRKPSGVLEMFQHLRGRHHVEGVLPVGRPVSVQVRHAYPLSGRLQDAVGEVAGAAGHVRTNRPEALDKNAGARADVPAADGANAFLVPFEGPQDRSMDFSRFQCRRSFTQWRKRKRRGGRAVPREEGLVLRGSSHLGVPVLGPGRVAGMSKGLTNQRLCRYAFPRH